MPLPRTTDERHQVGRRSGLNRSEPVGRVGRDVETAVALVAVEGAEQALEEIHVS